MAMSKPKQPFQEHIACANEVAKMLGVSHPKLVMPKLLEYQSQQLNAGKAFGRVVLPLEKYIYGSVNGFLNYMRDSLAEKMPMLGFVIPPKDAAAAQVLINANGEDFWRLSARGSAFGPDWQRYKQRTKWWYIAYRSIQQINEDNGVAFADDDWEILEKSLTSIWLDKKLLLARQLSYVTSFQGKKTVKKISAWEFEDFYDSVWNPLVAWFRDGGASFMSTEDGTSEGGNGFFDEIDRMVVAPVLAKKRKISSSSTNGGDESNGYSAEDDSADVGQL